MCVCMCVRVRASVRPCVRPWVHQATNNMNVANSYAVMNILSAAWTAIVVLLT